MEWRVDLFYLCLCFSYIKTPSPWGTGKLWRPGMPLSTQSSDISPPGRAFPPASVPVLSASDLIKQVQRHS